jgi:hypothetical protein
MGHGSGAVSGNVEHFKCNSHFNCWFYDYFIALVCAHLTSKEWSKDLFHKAIIMSGTSLLYDNDYYTSIRPAMSYSRDVDRISHAFSCFRRPSSALMDCLRRVDGKLLVDSLANQRWGPIIDDGESI